MSSIAIPRSDLVRYRRHFHAYPELSLVEFNTAAYLIAELEAFGFDELRTNVGGTGILATLKGGKPGPVTLLRADMDALPVTEINSADYASKHAGVMHACGHDAHMAILLGAAKALAERRADVVGTIVFCFQPAEEGPGGAQPMIDAGALENPHVDRVFALHMYTGLDVGYVGVRDGAFFASADHFRIRLHGQGGHGAMPDKAIDPIAAGAQLVSSLQSIVSREIPPKDPAVITVGHFHSGTTFNVIPDDALLEGTVRCFSNEIRKSMPERIERILNGVAAAYRVKPELEYHWNYPPTINDVEANGFVRKTAQKLFGDDKVVEHDIVLWAEDMAFMQALRPGAYFLVGARGSEKTGFPHHNARFDIDESALDVGYQMMVQIGLGGAETA